MTEEIQRIELEGGYIDLLQGANGSINPLGAVTVNHGSNQSFTIVAQTGYRITDVIIDGIPMNPAPSSPYTHVFSNVVADHTIAVKFGTISIVTHTITASVTAGSGTISPSGVTTVAEGGNLTYTLTPASGWSVQSIKIDGSNTSTPAATYSFTNVLANHTIAVTFEQIPSTSAGNAIFAAGHVWTIDPPGGIEYINIDTQGNAKEFGQLTHQRECTAACSDSTRAVIGGDSYGLSRKSNATLEQVTIATKCNGTEIGQLSQCRSLLGACSNATKGLFAGGEVADFYGQLLPIHNIDYIQFSSLSTAVSFGRLVAPRTNVAGCGNSNRGIFVSGSSIDYVTLSTTGDASNFGNLNFSRPSRPGAASNATRGIIFSGEPSHTMDPYYHNTYQHAEYITISTLGNATDYGNIPNNVSQWGMWKNSGVASSTRAVFGRGQTTPLGIMSSELFCCTIANLGGWHKFGDLVCHQESAGASNCHGGLQQTPIKYCVITASVIEGQGWISPPSASVVVGWNIAFTFMPAVNWEVSEVLIDGVSSQVSSPYQFMNIQSDHTIAVRFGQIPITYHTITSSVSSGMGTISPSPSVTVANGDNQTFTFTPNDGYNLSTVIVDGIRLDYSSSANNTYTFHSVITDHTISVEFSQPQVILNTSFTAARIGPLTYSFTDTTIGGPTQWIWDFGDGSPLVRTQNPTHTFPSAGTYAVQLNTSNIFYNSSSTDSFFEVE